MKPGELIRIRAAGTSDEWTLARVLTASGTVPQESVALALHGMVRAPGGFIAGFLPLTVDYEKESVIGLLGEEYEVEVPDAPMQLSNPGDNQAPPDSQTER